MSSSSAMITVTFPPILFFITISAAIIPFIGAITGSISPTVVLRGTWLPADPGNQTMWRKACDFPNTFGVIIIRTDTNTNTDSLASCATQCWATTTCTHFVYIINSTCHITSWNSRWKHVLQPIEITKTKLARLYACGYVPSRITTSALEIQTCTIKSTNFNRISIPMGDSNLPKQWISMMNTLVNMTISLNVFGVPKAAILREGKPLYQSMKCIIGQENISQEIGRNLRICKHYYNKTECNQIAPFLRSYSIDACIYGKTISVNSRGIMDLRGAKKNWVSATTLSSFHKSNAKKDLKTCLRRKMATSPILVDQIISDSLMNKAIVKDFISKAMKGEYSYFHGQFEDQVLKYFLGLKRMLCLVQSLLRNNCKQESYNQINKKKKPFTG